MSMTRRNPLLLSLAALAMLGCSESTEPTGVVPRQLYYFVYSGGQYNHYTLYGVALDGSQPYPVIEDTLPGGEYVDPEFAPWISRDGTEIMVRVYTWSDGYSFATVDRFGTVLSVVPYPDSVPIYPRPGLSPDGKRLAWIADRYLHIANLDGSPLQKIKFDTLTGASEDIVWSRDGASVAYVAWRYSYPNPYTPTDVRLWTRRLSDGFTRSVATLAGTAGAPAWSRDGRWLTITAGRSIHRVRTDGSGTEQVLYDGGLVGAWSSAWGPRDSLVAIAAGNGIVLIHPDGGSPRTLPVATGVASLAWGE